MLSGAILISGASSGIGLDAAIHIVGKGSRRRGRAAGCADMSAGFTVFAGVRKAADGDAAVAECVKSHGAERCGGLVPVILDVTEPSTIEATHAAVSGWVAQHGLPLIAVVNNAGITIGGPAECTEMHVTRNRLAACDWPSFTDAFAVMEVNYFGAVALTKQFLPLIRASKGRIINVSSLAGIVTTGSRSAYCGSKFALEGFSDSLRKEVRPLGVAVSLVNPGYVNTRIGEKAVQGCGAALTRDAQSAAQTSSRSRWTMSGCSCMAAICTTPRPRTSATLMPATPQMSRTRRLRMRRSVRAPRPATLWFACVCAAATADAAGQANVDGVPAIASAFVARVLPTHLFDLITEFF